MEPLGLRTEYPFLYSPTTFLTQVFVKHLGVTAETPWYQKVVIVPLHFLTFIPLLCLSSIEAIVKTLLLAPAICINAVTYFSPKVVAQYLPENLLSATWENVSLSWETTANCLHFLLDPLFENPEAKQVESTTDSQSPTPKKNAQSKNISPSTNFWTTLRQGAQGSTILLKKTLYSLCRRPSLLKVSGVLLLTVGAYALYQYSGITTVGPEASLLPSANTSLSTASDISKLKDMHLGQSNASNSSNPFCVNDFFSPLQQINDTAPTKTPEPQVVVNTPLASNRTLLSNITALSSTNTSTTSSTKVNGLDSFVKLFNKLKNLNRESQIALAWALGEVVAVPFSVCCNTVCSPTWHAAQALAKIACTLGRCSKSLRSLSSCRLSKRVSIESYAGDDFSDAKPNEVFFQNRTQNERDLFNLVTENENDFKVESNNDELSHIFIR